VEATDERKIAAPDVKRIIFFMYSFVHTLSTFSPQQIHSPGDAGASHDHFSISDPANFRWRHFRFDLSNRKRA
jgi:hypothetical protein